VRDEHLPGSDELGHAPYERRLAVAAGSEDDDVLAVADVPAQLADLDLAVGERLVEGQSAEAERIGTGFSQSSILRNNALRYHA
jgi:hypothetical protein